MLFSLVWFAFQARLVIKSSKVCGWDLGQLRILLGIMRSPTVPCRAAELCCASLCVVVRPFSFGVGDSRRQSETLDTCGNNWYIVIHDHTFSNRHYRVMLCNVGYAGYARKLNWPFHSVGFESRCHVRSQVQAGWCEHSSECSRSKRDPSFAHLVFLCAPRISTVKSVRDLNVDFGQCMGLLLWLLFKFFSLEMNRTDQSDLVWDWVAVFICFKRSLSRPGAVHDKYEVRTPTSNQQDARVHVLRIMRWSPTPAPHHCEA